MPRRLTNDLLLGLILTLVLTGVFGWALPVAAAAPLYDLHRVMGVAVLLMLLVWKQAVIRASLTRRLRKKPWDRSVLWGALVWSRRAAVRVAVLSLASVVGWQATRLGDRRFTGSKPVSPVVGSPFPAEIWLFDAVPLIDAAVWRLQLSGLVSATLTLDDLAAFPTRTMQE